MISAAANILIIQVKQFTVNLIVGSEFMKIKWLVLTFENIERVPRFWRETFIFRMYIMKTRERWVTV